MGMEAGTQPGGGRAGSIRLVGWWVGGLVVLRLAIDRHDNNNNSSHVEASGESGCDWTDMGRRPGGGGGGGSCHRAQQQQQQQQQQQRRRHGWDGCLGGADRLID